MWRLAVVRLFIVAFVSQSVVVIGTRLTQTGEIQDPLAPYIAILPGQPIENLEPFSCNWYTQHYEDSTRAVCRTNPEGDDSVSITIKNHTIQNLTFDVHGLTVGDLTRLWGRPIVGNYRGLYSVRWYRQGCVVTAPLSRRFSYRRPVRYFFVEADQRSVS